MSARKIDCREVAELIELVEIYMKLCPDSVVPVDDAQLERIAKLVKDVNND